MKAITGDDAGRPRRVRLDKPAATVHIGSGSAQAGLLIGKSAGEGIIYAKDAARPMVFTVESSLLDDLKKPADDFRVKDLFDARSFNTTRVEIVRNGQTSVFEKGREGRLEADRTRRQGRDTAKVEALITAPPGRARLASSTAPTVRARQPELTVTLKFDEGKDRRRCVRAAGADAYARRGRRPRRRENRPGQRSTPSSRRSTR